MQDETIAPHGVTIASRRRLLVGVGALVSACGASDTAASPVVIASTGRPLGLAPLFAMARPSDALAAAVPSTASLPPRPVISLRIATTIDGAINLVSTGAARAAVVPRGTAAATPGFGVARSAHTYPSRGVCGARGRASKSGSTHRGHRYRQVTPRYCQYTFCHVMQLHRCKVSL